MKQNKVSPHKFLSILISKGYFSYSFLDLIGKELLKQLQLLIGAKVKLIEFKIEESQSALGIYYKLVQGVWKANYQFSLYFSDKNNSIVDCMISWYDPSNKLALFPENNFAESTVLTIDVIDVEKLLSIYKIISEYDWKKKLNIVAPFPISSKQDAASVDLLFSIYGVYHGSIEVLSNKIASAIELFNDKSNQNLKLTEDRKIHSFRLFETKKEFISFHLDLGSSSAEISLKLIIENIMELNFSIRKIELKFG